jgi:hypothetical protein
MFYVLILLGQLGVGLGFLTPLKTIVVSKTIASSLQTFVSNELMDEKNMMGSVFWIHDISSFDSFVVFATLSSLYMFVYHTNRPDTSKVYKWKESKILDRRIRIFLVVFMTVMFKNIDNAI